MEWVADYPVLWLAALVAAALVAGFVLRGVGVKNRREYGWALGAVSGGLIVLYACFVIEYALSPAFSDHVEPQIAAVSCLFMRGKARLSGADGGGAVCAAVWPLHLSLDGGLLLVDGAVNSRR